MWAPWDLVGRVGHVRHRVPAGHPIPRTTPTGIFLLAILVANFPDCTAFYVRAYKQEPLLAVSVVSSVLIGVGVWWFGRWCGPLGMAWVYLAVIACTNYSGRP